MEHSGLKFEFTAKPYYCSTSDDMSGWVFAALPREMSAEIRKSCKCFEQGWGRLKATAKVGGSEWQTSVWFSKESEAYLLPLKAAIRKKEKVELDKDVRITIWV